MDIGLMVSIGVGLLVVAGGFAAWRLVHVVTRTIEPSHGSSTAEDQTSQFMAQIDAHRGASKRSREPWDGDYRLETGDTNASF